MTIKENLNKLPMSRNNLILICVLLVVILNLEAALMILRAVLGLLFVLFIPGYIATYAFFGDVKGKSISRFLKGKYSYKQNISKEEPEEEIDLLERIALSVGLSISLVVLTVMFSNLYLKIPINLFTIVLEILSICVFFGGIALFQRYDTCMKQYNGFISKITFVGHPERKKKLFIIAGVSVISLFLVVDIFYPSIFPENESQVNAPNIIVPYNLSDLYNESMTVYSFYPQKNIVQNITNVTIPYPIVNSFDDKIAFLGYDIDTRDVKAGEKFHIKYFWKALAEVDINYTVFVHITDINDTIRFQHDHAPPVKTSLWKKGDILMEEYDALVPPTVDEGSYFMRIGLYNKQTGARLSIVSGQFIDGEKRAIISRINIVE